MSPRAEAIYRRAAQAAFNRALDIGLGEMEAAQKAEQAGQDALDSWGDYMYEHKRDLELLK